MAIVACYEGEDSDGRCRTAAADDEEYHPVRRQRRCRRRRRRRCRTTDSANAGSQDLLALTVHSDDSLPVRAMH